MKAWLVNSNKKPENNGSHCFEYMIRQNKVAAYYEAKTQIDQIHAQDLVLLYHKQCGVIAVGFIVKEFTQPDYELGKIEHWADVNWIWKATFNDKKDPVNAIDYKYIGINMLMPTVVNITGQLNHKLLLEEIAKRQTYM